MNNSRLLTIALGSVLIFSAPLAAQGRGKGKSSQGIPPGHMPPAGLCRIWIDGVPPGRQPAPTDCETAIRNRPANARIIYGSRARGGDVYRDRADERYDKKGRVRTRDRDDDRNDDGRDDSCVDRNGDGRCDGRVAVPRLPSRLPVMLSTSVLGDQVVSATQRQWFGNQQVVTRWVDADENGMPERISWFTVGGQLLQVWSDDDANGRADRVEVFENGRRVATHH